MSALSIKDDKLPGRSSSGAADPIDVLKLRVLLAFLNEAPKVCTVTGFSNLFGEGKQKMSRLLITMEKEGLICRENVRNPQLTAYGLELAKRFDDRYNVVLNHLLYEGVDLDSAEHDALIQALYLSAEGIRTIRQAERCYQAKYRLRKQSSFSGEELCSFLPDGEYRLAFLFYRETACDGEIVSMANRGFEHPCTLSLKEGTGKILLTPLVMEARSKTTGALMAGSIRNLTYLEHGRFKPAHIENESLVIPPNALSFLNMGSGIGQILHGSVIMRMDCSVGTAHMPESTAIFTMFI